MTFEVIAGKLQEELIDIIKSKKDVNEYELIVYKYVFISELEIPLFEDFGIEISENSFILYLIPDDLQLSLLVKLANAFDKFNVTFMPNTYNILKLKFELSD
jgi:hypothetical protein